ncbi:hypothetical protein VTJ83DRAFT_5755 [Remersonia thermophila]|uniref:MARVEL domain-containing protein n=1 Tax=Remersonia thermophila TaxID=72144 RepID=A0ABR4D7U2_9PEZI
MKKHGLGKGFASLFGLHLLVRILHGLCAIVVLALFSYFLATLGNSSLPTGTWVRAVEGIAGTAVGYTIIAGLLLSYFPGRSVPTFITMVFDVLFSAAFIYVAVANRGGSGSCSTGEVDTAFGRGDVATNVRSEGTPGAGEDAGSLPSLRQACQMEKACLITSCIAIVLLALSPFISVAIVRRRKKVLRRTIIQPDNVGVAPARRKGLFGLFGQKGTAAGETENPNELPEHPTPQSLTTSQSYFNGGHSHGQGSGGYGNLGDGTDAYGPGTGAYGPGTDAYGPGNSYPMDSYPKRENPYYPNGAYEQPRY